MQLYTNTPTNELPQRIKVGHQLLKNGATSEAEQIFRELAKQAPQNPDVLRGLGGAYFASGQYVGARHEFQRALRVDAKDRASSDGLAMTNEVIDLDPLLPNLTSAERLRRSQNLLNRVLKDLKTCSATVIAPPVPEQADSGKGQANAGKADANVKSAGHGESGKAGAGAKAEDQPAANGAQATGGAPSAADQLAQRFAGAQELLTKPVADNDDAALSMQNTAQKLWSERKTLCKDNMPSDRPLETVMARVGHE